MRRRIGAIGAVVTMCFIVGCGGGGSGHVASKANSSDTTVASDTTSVRSSSSFNPPDPCTLVTREEAEAVLGSPITQKTEQGVVSCVYVNNGPRENRPALIVVDFGTFGVNEDLNDVCRSHGPDCTVLPPIAGHEVTAIANEDSELSASYVPGHTVDVRVAEGGTDAVDQQIALGLMTKVLSRL